MHPITKEAFELLGNRQSPNEIVFQNMKRHESNYLDEWAIAAGIARHITFHTARHTYATLQLDSGSELRLVSKMLGHANTKTTERYTHIIDKQRIEAANKISLK